MKTIKKIFGSIDIAIIYFILFLQTSFFNPSNISFNKDLSIDEIIGMIFLFSYLFGLPVVLISLIIINKIKKNTKIDKFESIVFFSLICMLCLMVIYGLLNFLIYKDIIYFFFFLGGVILSIAVPFVFIEEHFYEKKQIQLKKGDPTSPDLFEKVKVIIYRLFLITIILMVIEGFFTWYLGLFSLIFSTLGFCTSFITIMILVIFSDEFKIHDHLVAGVFLFKQYEYEKALIQFKQATEAFPNSICGWHHLGLTYHELLENDQAIEAFNKALKLDPNNGDAWKVLGEIYLDRREFQESCNAYRHSVELIPEDYYAWHDFARALLSIGNDDEAEKAFKQEQDLIAEWEQGKGEKKLKQRDENKISGMYLEQDKIGTHSLILMAIFLFLIIVAFIFVELLTF